jgi:hypothetical protein
MPFFRASMQRVRGFKKCARSAVEQDSLHRLMLQSLATLLLGSANLFEGDATAERVREVLAASAPADSCGAFLKLPAPRPAKIVASLRSSPGLAPRAETFEPAVSSPGTQLDGQKAQFPCAHKQDALSDQALSWAHVPSNRT